MLDVNEQLFPLTDAPKHHPVPNPPHSSTFFRWALRGVGKSRVKLETVKIGGRRFTSRAALQRFVERLTGLQEEQESLSRLRTEAYHEAACEAEREGL